MTDQQQSAEITELGYRVASLERKISELYRRLDQEEPNVRDDSGFSVPAEQAAGEDPRVLELIQAGNEMQAIKLYRQLAGVSLGEAKDAVEGLAAMHRPTG